jgi:hydroxymethylglutaryl-CoA lyase
MSSTHPGIIQITETPRDAMQGLTKVIATKDKVQYINLLLKCGFEMVDTGSFVSPKAVPQMADTAEVLSLLDTELTKSKLMVIVGNSRGGVQAAAENKIHAISFPYSVSKTFLKRNLNTTPEAAWQTVLDLKNLCDQSQKELRIYITMAFGNPYGDDWNDEIVNREVERLYAEGIRDLVFSDVTGEGTPGNIERICSEIINSFPGAKPGIHLHTKPDDWQEKVEAAWRGGMRNFEGALGGFGGCPMTGYELLGNLDTYNLVDWCKTQGISTGIDENKLLEARSFAQKILQ